MPDTMIPADRAGELAELKHRLAAHPLYDAVDSAKHLKVFLQHHLVCVFDFMSLLKSLQQELAPARTPWLPSPDPEATRLVNEIVLDEESDALPHRPGEHGSHFSWYLDGMSELGMDLAPIERWLALVEAGRQPPDAMQQSGMPASAVEFVRTTMSFLSEPLAVRAAVFCHSREDVIPRMFAPLVSRLIEAEGIGCTIFASYLQRHIDLDGREHGDHAVALLDRLCADDLHLRLLGEACAAVALRARIKLWDDILAAVAG